MIKATGQGKSQEKSHKIYPKTRKYIVWNHVYNSSLGSKNTPIEKEERKKGIERFRIIFFVFEEGTLPNFVFYSKKENQH